VSSKYVNLGILPGMSEMPKRIGAGIELLADPTRRRIIATLALSVHRPSNLAEAIGLSRPATARQLHLLQDAGLIRSSRSPVDGRVMLYSLEPRQIGRITAWLAGTEIARPTMEPRLHRKGGIER
jgi:DNA-binding transcriptional ArsR family regulator